MLLLIFLLWFVYALVMTAIIVSAWAVRIAVWLLVAAWRVGRWAWRRYRRRRQHEGRRE